MSKPVILVPRPAPHLPRTLAALQQAGFTNLLELPTSHPQPQTITLPPTTSLIILTSALAIPSLKTKSIPVCCVGTHTAQVAQAAGFTVLLTGSGNADDLAAAILQRFPKPQHIAHLCGDKASHHWHTHLLKHGHTIAPHLAYQTRPITTLPPSILKARPTHTLLFSAGSANHLANLLKQANMVPTGTAIALSAAVERAAQSHWPRVRTAPRPTLASLIGKLQKDC